MHYRKEVLLLGIVMSMVISVMGGEMVDDFSSADSKELWEVTAGYNLKNTITPGIEGPRKIKCTEFKMEFLDESKKNDGNGRWFNATRLLNVNPDDWKKAEGFSIMLSTDNPNAWYFSAALQEEDGTKFPLKLTPTKLFRKYIFKFADLSSEKDPNRKINPEKVIAILFGSATYPATLYIGPMELINMEKKAVDIK